MSASSVDHSVAPCSWAWMSTGWLVVSLYEPYVIFTGFGMNRTSEKRHLCGMYPNVRQPLYNQMSWSRMSNSAFWIVMKIVSVITSCFIRALEHVPARIVVSTGWEPGKSVSSRRFRESFSLSVHEPSAFVNRQDGCGLTERNFRSLAATAALSIISQKVLQFLLLADLISLFSFVYL